MDIKLVKNLAKSKEIMRGFKRGIGEHLGKVAAEELTRQTVTLKPHELVKLQDIEKSRPELRGLTISEKVHLALVEWIGFHNKEKFNNGADTPHDNSPVV